MSEAAETAERGRDLERLLTFVDAIAAIAITLLVLPLVELVPEVREEGDVAELLRVHADELWTFALSFYVISRFWFAQHHAVAPLLAGNARISLVLTGWTFTIVVLPFTTALVAVVGDQPLTKVLYVGTMAVSMVLVSALRREVRAHPELTDGSAYAGPGLSLVTAAMLVVALAIMLAAPALSYLPLLLLLLDTPIASALGWTRNRGR